MLLIELCAMPVNSRIDKDRDFALICYPEAGVPS